MVHILLVEDNPGDVLLVREAVRLSAVDADVLIAYDGEQAERFLLNDPSLIILDLNVPKFSGFQILERHRVQQRAPVVVLTCSDNPADEKRALELGANEYVVKPARHDAFISSVRSMIERWIGRASSLAPV